MFAADGYIVVFQDVRGKDKSESKHVMTRPGEGATQLRFNRDRLELRSGYWGLPDIPVWPTEPPGRARLCTGSRVLETRLVTARDHVREASGLRRWPHCVAAKRFARTWLTSSLRSRRQQ